MIDLINPLKAVRPALVLLACFTATTWAREKPVNVLMIMADDIGFECFSSYGSQEYSTPRLEALAKAGIRFGN